MLSTSQIRSVVLIVALAHVVNNSFSYGPEIQCNWNCSNHKADLTGLKREMENLPRSSPSTLVEDGRNIYT